jgi:hypothetical protein
MLAHLSPHAWQGLTQKRDLSLQPAPTITPLSLKQDLILIIGFPLMQEVSVVGLLRL